MSRPSQQARTLLRRAAILIAVMPLLQTAGCTVGDVITYAVNSLVNQIVSGTIQVITLNVIDAL